MEKGHPLKLYVSARLETYICAYMVGDGNGKGSHIYFFCTTMQGELDVLCMDMYMYVLGM